MYLLVCLLRDSSGAQIHSTKEILIQDMMEFHMDQDQRTRFLTGARPTNLPQELSNRLPSHLQRFLRDEYAPAFLSRSLAQDEDYGKNFTDSERRKIRYWWEGNVSSRLHCIEIP